MSNTLEIPNNAMEILLDKVFLPIAIIIAGGIVSGVLALFFGLFRWSMGKFVRSIDEKFTGIGEKFDTLNNKFDSFDTQLKKQSNSINELKTDMQLQASAIREVEVRIEYRLQGMEKRLIELEKDKSEQSVSIRNLDNFMQKIQFHHNSQHPTDKI
jgi:septal ring factor EnvC (AmiA/AmiB activator)